MSTALDYNARTAHARASSTTAAMPSTRPIADFDKPATSAAGLPDPTTLLVNLTRCVIEILAGVRELDQVARWVSDDVYTNLLRRVTIALRARAVTGGSAARPRLTVGDPVISEPCSGVVEAVVVAHQPTRSRAVAIRLESLDGRWRANAITVL